MNTYKYEYICHYKLPTLALLLLINLICITNVKASKKVKNKEENRVIYLIYMKYQIQLTYILKTFI